mmetsp:Transcript_81/g.139  ORF Transcript_81/g.139 Transcript_81/m.139 type:complete len:215 (+) Transcript_81:261-905(+)
MPLSFVPAARSYRRRRCCSLPRPTGRLRSTERIDRRGGPPCPFQWWLSIPTPAIHAVAGAWWSAGGGCGESDGPSGREDPVREGSPEWKAGGGGRHRPGRGSSRPGRREQRHQRRCRSERNPSGPMHRSGPIGAFPRQRDRPAFSPVTGGRHRWTCAKGGCSDRGRRPPRETAAVLPWFVVSACCKQQRGTGSRGPCSGGGGNTRGPNGRSPIP